MPAPSASSELRATLSWLGRTGTARARKDMALRATGKRNPKLRAAAITLARRLAASDADSARWIGRHTLKELDR